MSRNDRGIPIIVYVVFRDDRQYLRTSGMVTTAVLRDVGKKLAESRADLEELQ